MELKGIGNEENEREISMVVQFFDMVEQFENRGEQMTSISRYKLLMKIWSETVCWGSFNKITRQTLLEQEMPDFEPIKNTLEFDK